jgi:hypothetical protein
MRMALVGLIFVSEKLKSDMGPPSRTFPLYGTSKMPTVSNQVAGSITITDVEVR